MLLTIHNAFHIRGDVDRLYLKRADGGRGMICAEDCVQIEINCLNKYVNESDELMLKAVAKEEILHEGRTKTEIKQERSEKFNNCLLYTSPSPRDA